MAENPVIIKDHEGIPSKSVRHEYFHSANLQPKFLRQYALIKKQKWKLGKIKHKKERSKTSHREREKSLPDIWVQKKQCFRPRNKEKEI